MANYSIDVSDRRIRTALSWAIRAFRGHAVALLVSTVVFTIVLVALSLALTELVELVTPAPRVVPEGTDAAGRLAAYLSSARNLASMLARLVVLIVLGVMQSAYFGGVLDIAAGHRVTLTSFLKPRRFGDVILASLVAGVVFVAVSTAFSVVGGVIGGIHLMLTIVVLLDHRELSPMAAVKASMALGHANFWDLALALVVAYAILVVGFLALGAGVLAAIPVATLFMFYEYRQLTGGGSAPS